MLWAEVRGKYGEMGKMTIPAKQYSRLSGRWEKSNPKRFERNN